MWSFTGISSDGYNALYTCKPLALQASAALWGLLLGVDRADLRLWQGHSQGPLPVSACHAHVLDAFALYARDSGTRTLGWNI